MALVWSRHEAGVDLPGAVIEQVWSRCQAGAEQVWSRRGSAHGAGMALHGEGREPPPCAALPGGDAVCTQ